METFSWTRVIRPNLVAFRFLGLWPKGSTLYKANLYTLYSAVIIILLLSVHNLSQVLNIFVVYPDLQNLTETIFITVTNVLTLIKAYYFVKKHEYLEAPDGNLGERRVPAQELPTRESNPARFDLLEESQQRTCGDRGILFDRLVFHSSSERQEAIAVRKLVPFRYRIFAEIRIDVFAPSGQHLVLRHDQSQSRFFDFCVDDVRWGSM
jgi:hypothetical protein